MHDEANLVTTALETDISSEECYILSPISSRLSSTMNRLQNPEYPTCVVTTYEKDKILRICLVSAEYKEKR
jgi:hypothetical protein